MKSYRSPYWENVSEKLNFNQKEKRGIIMRGRKLLEKDCNRKRREANFEQHIFSKEKDGTNRSVINLKKTRPVFLIQPFQVRKSTFGKLFPEEGHFCVQLRPQGSMFLHYEG